MYFLKHVNYNKNYNNKRGGHTLEDNIKVSKSGVILTLIVLAAIFFFIFCFRTVDAGQVGIIKTFGNVNRVATSGVAIKAPWPIESLDKMEIRVQKEEQDVTAATRDMQDVNAKLALNFALDNETALKVYKELGKDYKARVIIPALQESFKAAASEYSAQELITERTAIKIKSMEVIKSRLEKYGIRVVDLNIVNFSFSAAFNQAIESKQVAVQQAEKAKQDLVRIQVEAEQAITSAKGQAEAQRLQKETITPELIEWKKIEAQRAAIDKWNGVLPTTQAGENTILSIPKQ